MKKFLRALFILAFIIGVVQPVAAVFEEGDLNRTLRVLKYELRHAYNRAAKARIIIEQTRLAQQKQMFQLMEDCNELSLMLYSQKQNFTFDLTYALEEVTKKYEAFYKQRRPYVNIMQQIDVEIERYTKMIATLQQLPPAIVDSTETQQLEGGRATINTEAIKQLNTDIKNLHNRHLLNETRYQKGIEERIQKQMEQKMGEGNNFPKEDEDSPMADSLRKSTNKNILKAIANVAITGNFGRQRPVKTDTIKTISMLGDSTQASADSTTIVYHDEYINELTGRALVYRDSCIFYAENLRELYLQTKEDIINDSTHYDATWNQLKEAYEYAQSKYLGVQKRIFVDGQTNYFYILAQPKKFLSRVKNDISDKWEVALNPKARSQWRPQTIFGLMLFVTFYLLVAFGLSKLIVRLLTKKVKFFRSERFKSHGLCLMLLGAVVIFSVATTIAMMSSTHYFMKMATRLLVEFAWLLAAIFLSFAIRLQGDQVRSGIKAYFPIMLLSLILIFIRITFIPNTLINLGLPALLLLFTLWQYHICKKLKNRIPFSDKLYNYFTLTVLVATTIVAWSGYVLLSIIIIIWWIFQLSVIQSITAISDLMRIFYNRLMIKRKRAYSLNHYSFISKKSKGSYIEVSWLYDMLKMAVVPAITIWSIPLCVYMAAGVFDLESICLQYLRVPFLHYDQVIDLSVMKVLTATSLFFIFRYGVYALQSFYRIYRIRTTLNKTKLKELPENMINFTLSNSIINICTWGAYIVLCFLLLEIPSTAISIIGAGLATGIGFALKDVINNFFYGVSLMSGRLRVGDYVECDGIRGVVDSITYQSTMIQTETGSIMAFPNTNLYSKNFKNLTRNNAYELLIIPIGVRYGTEVAKVRELLKKALIKLNLKDKYGRELLDSSYGIVVRLSEFGDNSILLKVYQYVLVTERYKYNAAANEIIYNTLNENGIEIPFPQRDIYIKQIKQNRDKEELEAAKKGEES